MKPARHQEKDMTTRPAFTREDLEFGLAGDLDYLATMTAHLRILEAGGNVENLSPENARRNIDAVTACIANKRALLAAMDNR